MVSFNVNILEVFRMRLWLFSVVLILAGCDNQSWSVAPNYSLFETSGGVVYLINQSTGELKQIAPTPVAILHAGEVFKDGDGPFYKYLGDGGVERIDE